MGYSLIGCSGSANLVPGAGNFVPLGASTNTFQTSTEATYSVPMPVAGTVWGLRCDQGPFSGTFTAQLRKNGAAAFQAFNQGQPVATGSDSYVAGDLIGLQFPTVTSPSIARVQAILQTAGPHTAIYASPSGTGSLATNTYYLRQFGTTGSASSLAAGTQSKAGVAGTASRLFMNAATNTTTASSTLAYNANGANGTQLVTIAAGLTGVFIDTTNTDPIAVNDLYCTQFVVGAGGGIGIGTTGFGFTSLAPANDLYVSGSVLTSTTAYFCLYGTTGAGWATEAPALITHGFPVTLSNLAVGVPTNLATSNSTVFLSKNGVAGSPGVVIAAGLTGWFTDTTNSVSLAPTDTASYRIISGPGGAVTYALVGVTETAPLPTTGGYSLIAAGTNILTYVPTLGWSGPFCGSHIQSIQATVNPQNEIPFPVPVRMTFGIAPTNICAPPCFAQVSKNNKVAASISDAGNVMSLDYGLGDTIGINWGTSNTLPRIQAVLLSTGGVHGAIYGAPGASSYTTGVTYYPRFCGTISSATNAGTKTDMRSGAAGTLQRMAINVVTNATTAASTFSTLKNDTTAGNQTISIGAGLTGVFMDTSHTDALVAGDLFCGQLVVGAGGSFTPSIVVVGFVNTASQASDLYSVGPATTAASTNSFLALVGSNGAAGTPGFTTETQAQVAHGFALTASNLTIAITTNTTTAASTLVSRKNLANGNLSVAIGAGLLGWFTDTTNSDTVAATDGYCALLTTGVGGSLTNFQLGVTETAPNAPWAVAVAETGAAIDAPTDKAVYLNQVAELGAAADTVAATEVIASANVAETTFVDDHVTSFRLFPHTVAETGDAEDTVVSRPIVFAATVHEAGAAADAVTTTVAFGDVVAERGTAADTAGTAAIFPRAVAEVGAAADTAASFSFYLAGVVAEVGDAEDTEPFAHVHGHLSAAEHGAAADAPSSSSVMPAGVAEAGAATSLQITTVIHQGVIAEAGAAADTCFEFVGHLLPAGSMTLTGYAPTTPGAWWDLTGVPTIWTPLTPPPATHP